MVPGNFAFFISLLPGLQTAQNKSCPFIFEGPGIKIPGILVY